jgi:hypothetical protein
MALAALQAGIPVDQVANFSGLSRDQLDALLNQ